MQDFTFERPDAADIEIIRHESGRIIHAQKKDHSILAYLLRIHLADHGHEAAATTYLDWKLAFGSISGVKISNYGTSYGGSSDTTKASLYLRLITKLGRNDQTAVEYCINPENPEMAELMNRLTKQGFQRGTATGQKLEAIGQRYIGHIDRLSRLIPQVRKELEDAMQKVVDREIIPR